MSYLVDTNLVSELTRRFVNPGVAAWAQGVRRVCVSAITVEEVFYGLSWKPNARIHLWFEDYLAHGCEVLAVTPEIARSSGGLRGMFQAQGETRSQADMLIAATAAVHGLTLVTRNVRDFEGCGVGLLNPFR